MAGTDGGERPTNKDSREQGEGTVMRHVSNGRLRTHTAWRSRVTRDYALGGQGNLRKDGYRWLDVLSLLLACLILRDSSGVREPIAPDARTEHVLAPPRPPCRLGPREWGTRWIRCEILRPPSTAVRARQVLLQAWLGHGTRLHSSHTAAYLAHGHNSHPESGGLFPRHGNS